MLGKGHGGLYKAPTKEERRSERLTGEGDKIKFRMNYSLLVLMLHARIIGSVSRYGQLCQG